MTAGCRAGGAAAGLTVGAGFVCALWGLAVSKGAGPEALSERTGIDPSDLQDPDGRVPLARYVALMRAGKELCGDPALALHFGEAFDCAEMSVVGLLGRASATLADGFALLNRYSRLAVEVEVDGTGTGERYQLVREAGRLWMLDTRKNPNDCPELTESAFARMVCHARRHPGDGEFIEAAHFTHAEPAYRAEYERVFRMPVVFGGARNALLMKDEAWLTRKNALCSPYAYGLLSAHAESLLESLDSSKSTRGRVESLLAPALRNGEATMAAVARELGLSRQTLFRKLKAEGVTFERVLDELRHRLALEYLCGGRASVNETAYLLGFSDPAAFSRAFKRWTGARPRTLRAPKSDASQTAPHSPPA